MVREIARLRDDGLRRRLSEERRHVLAVPGAGHQGPQPQRTVIGVTLTTDALSSIPFCSRVN